VLQPVSSRERNHGYSHGRLFVRLSGSFLQSGSAELAEQKQGARRKMDLLLDQYEAAGVFPAVTRREPPAADSASRATEN
jgi:hypothetical protein